MNEEQKILMDDLSMRVIQGIADDTDRSELIRLMITSSDHRRRFVDSAILHGMLIREARGRSFAHETRAFYRHFEHSPKQLLPRFARFLIPAAALLLISILVISFLPAKASAALDQLIGNMKESGDRTYRIEVIEAPDEALLPRGEKGRFPPGNYLHGSILWLRGDKEFVLSQNLPNGQKRIMGRDADQSWSLRGHEPLRLSHDPDRFSRAIFAKNGDIAFLDLRTQLNELKHLFNLKWIDRNSPELWKLSGTRKSDNQGGPREIEIWFNPQTEILQRMILRQLPRANGGPRSVAIILLSSEPLPPDWFQHHHHHEPNRKIFFEP